jgi:hypothetical protein
LLRNALRVATILIAFEIVKDLILERITDNRYLQLALGFPFGLFGMWVVEPLVETIVRLRVVTIIDLPPITIIDASRGLQRAVVPVASSLRSRIVVPFPLVSRWRNGERTDDLAQTPVDHGTSFCVGPQRPCPRSLATLTGSPPSS